MNTHAEYLRGIARAAFARLPDEIPTCQHWLAADEIERLQQRVYELEARVSEPPNERLGALLDEFEASVIAHARSFRQSLSLKREEALERKDRARAAILESAGASETKDAPHG